MSIGMMRSASASPFDTPDCGALGHSDGSVTWRVWAPNASSAELVLYSAGAPENVQRRLPMQPEPHGYFSHVEAEVLEGQRYAFRLGGGPERPDPVSRWQPDGVHRPSAVLRLNDFKWSENDWPGLPRERLVIYELHVGT